MTAKKTILIGILGILALLFVSTPGFAGDFLNRGRIVCSNMIMNQTGNSLLPANAQFFAHAWVTNRDHKDIEIKYRLYDEDGNRVVIPATGWITIEPYRSDLRSGGLNIRAVVRINVGLKWSFLLPPIFRSRPG